MNPPSSHETSARNSRLKGKVALVAGATRGAGRGIAIALGEAGATVYCSGRSTRRGSDGDRVPQKKVSRMFTRGVWKPSKRPRKW